jgi:phage-related protein
MCAATVAQLAVDVTANTEKAQRGLAAVNDTVGKAPALFKAATIAVGAFVGAGVAIAAIFGGALVYAIKQASDANVLIAQTNQLLLSTHDASGMSAQGIDDLTNKLEALTGIDDDVVRTATNMLLSFRGIGKDVFPQATQSSLDLATFLNNGLLPTQEQVQQASILMGKALNDPVQGMTALRRVGITLSAAQQEQVKHFMAVNDIADAQKVILGEVTAETGGAAEAAGNTLPGMLAKLKNSFNDVFKAVGFVVLPVLNAFMGLVVKLVQPLGDKLQGAIGAVGKRFNDLMTALKPLQQPLQALWDGAKALWNIFTTNLQPAIKAIGDALSGSFNPNIHDAANKLTDFVLNGVKQAAPIVKDLAQNISNLVKNGLQKWNDLLNSDFVKHLHDVADTMRGQLGPAVKQLGDWFQHQLVPAVKEVAPKFQDLANTFVTQVYPAITDINVKLAEFRLWLAVNVLPIVEKIIPPLLRFAGTLAKDVSDAIKSLKPHLDDIGRLFQQAKNGASAWQPALQAIGGFIQTTVIPAVKNFADKVKDFLPHLKEFGDWLQQHIAPVIKDLADKFKQAQPHIQQLATDIGVRLMPIMQHMGIFINTVLLPVLGQIGEFIKTQVQPKLKDFQAFWNAIWPGIQATISTVWGVIQGIITIAWNIISGIIKVGLDILGGNWKQAWKDMQQAFSGVWQGIQQIGQSLFGKLKDWIVQKAGELKDNVLSKLGELPGKLKDLGGQMIQKLGDAIRNGAGKIADAFRSVLQTASNNLPFGLHIPGFASGTLSAPGGLAWVGEGRTAELVVGPHLMNLPRGAQVLPVTSVQSAGTTAGNGSGRGGGGGNTYVTNVYPQQATLDTAALARIQRRRELLTGMGVS